MASLPYLLPADKLESMKPLIEQRIKEVGPIPRKVFCNAMEYQDFKDKLHDVMETPALVTHAILAGPQALVDAEHHKDKPLSAAFSIGVDPKAGENKYKTRVLQFVSDYARDQLQLTTLKQLWTSMISASPNSFLQNLFESLVVRLLQSGWHCVAFELGAASHQGKVINLTAASGGVVAGGGGSRTNGYARLAQMNCIKNVDDKVARGATHFLGNFPVLDAADARNRWFQITTAKKKEGHPSINSENAYQGAAGGRSWEDNDLGDHLSRGFGS